MKEDMAQMKLYTLDEIVEDLYGAPGTAAREDFEEDMRQLEAEWQRTHRMGSTVKRARKELHLTQAELGRQADVRPSVVSRIERGLIDGCSLESLVRVLRALGMTLTLGTPGGQRVELA